LAEYTRLAVAEMTPKVVFLVGSGAKPSTVALDLADAEEALVVAKQMAEHTGRTVTVRDAEGEILGRIEAVARN
jgi:hypothetical protein